MKNQTQEFSIKYSIPDKDFWKKYDELWKNSLYVSPFQSPHIIEYLSSEAKSSFALYQYILNGELVGIVFFRLKNKTYTFLTDVKSDHNFFVIHNKLSSTEIEFFFKGFFQKIKEEGWSLELNKQPMWASYMNVFTKLGEQSNLYWQNLDYQVCPILKAENANALYANLKKSRNNRYKTNRFVKNEKGIFEALTDDYDLENWVKEFCHFHAKRWENTPTPSAYKSEKMQVFLTKCLRMWNKDNLLVRFSARTGDKRIAFCIGLRQGNNLIYHSLTYDINYSKYSPIKILILYTGKWMSENNLNVLDFGIGDEIYKYRFANEELKLNRIFISSQRNFPFILKSKLIKTVKQNPEWYSFYANKMKPVFNKVLK